MSDQPNVNVFEEIQSLSREFRKRLKSEAPPVIEDYVGRVDELARETLFQNLLNLEIQFLNKQGTPPSSAEYHRRFPQYSRLIRQALFESTMMSQAVDENTPASQETMLVGLPPTRRIGDYELIRELGRGGFGVVYEARHAHRGDRVALKTLPIVSDGQTHPLNDAERLHKFRREFRSLSEINHPNLIGMQTLEVAGDQWFFTMDLVDGVDFLDYVRPQGKLDELRLRKALSQLVRGISALHERGIVHRDLKPSNVLVSPEGRVTILDFGLVAELQQTANQTLSMKSRQFAGTPRYAAPEQMTGTRLPASDWYAVGGLLFEALTGEMPFEGAAVEVMFKKQSESAPKLAGTPELPSDLAELVDQLLQREPDHRPSFQRIREVLGVESEATQEDSTDSSLSPVFTISDQFLIGRDHQLAELQQAYANLISSRQPAVTMISGRSGEGKSSLADKFLEPLRLHEDVVVLSGRCYDRESVPFKAVDTLIDALVSYLRSRSDDDVHRWLPDDIAMLAQLFPVLRRVQAIADRSLQEIRGIDSRQIRYRAFHALRELLTSMSQTTPIVLFIDDLQWGDADSAAALFEVLAPPESPTVLFLGTYRSDEAEESPFLSEWRRKNPADSPILRETQVEVAPLTEDECVRLIAHRLGGGSDRVRVQAQKLFDETRGNPYFLDQLLEGFNEQTGEFQAIPLDEIISQRLQRLPQEATTLLEVIAIAGQAASIEEIAQVAQSAGQSFSTLTHMRTERLIRLIGSSGLQRVDTYHDKIRETVLAEMDDSNQRELHTQYGEYLEKIEHLSAEQILQSLDHDLAIEDGDLPNSDRIFDLAYHFHAADDGRAFAYQLMAGEWSYKAYATEDAVEFFNRAAVAIPSQTSRDIRFRLYVRLARSLVRLRDFEKALEQFDNAFREANSQLQRVMVYEGIGTAYCIQSDFRMAINNYDRALAELGFRRPKGIAALFRCFPQLVWLAMLPPKWEEQIKCSGTQAARFSLAQEIHNNLLTFIWELPDGMCSYPYYLLRTVNCARYTKGQVKWAKSIAHAAGQLSLNGFPWMGKWLLGKVEQVTLDIKDDDARGLVIGGMAMTNQYSGKLPEADQQWGESILLLQNAGNHVFAGASSHMHRHLHAVIAPSSTETGSGERTLVTAQRLKDKRTQCWGHYDIASGQARAGDISSALYHLESARQYLCPGERNVTDAIFLGAEGYVRLQASAYESARFSLESSWHLAKSRKLLMDVVTRTLPYLIESLLGPDWRQPPIHSDRKRLKRLCRVLVVLDWLYPNVASPAQRARGRAFCSLGQTKWAMRSFQKAVVRANTFGADYDKARSLLDLAAVKEEGRDENRREAIELLKKMESVIPYAERWLLGDQYDDSVVAPNPESLRELSIPSEKF